MDKRIRIKVLPHYNTTCFNDHTIPRKAIKERTILRVREGYEKHKWYIRNEDFDKGMPPEEYDWYVLKSEAELFKPTIIIEEEDA